MSEPTRDRWQDQGFILHVRVRNPAQAREWMRLYETHYGVEILTIGSEQCLMDIMDAVPRTEVEHGR
jgi:hypothetical protein